MTQWLPHCISSHMSLPGSSLNPTMHLLSPAQTEFAECCIWCQDLEFLVRIFSVYHQGWGLSLHLGVLNPMSPCLTYLTELLSGWPLSLPFLLSLTWNLCFNCQLSLHSSLDFLVLTSVSSVRKWQLHREGLLCPGECQKHPTAFAKAFLYVLDVQQIMFKSHTWSLHLLFISLAHPL